jgi:hypothetical protein
VTPDELRVAQNQITAPIVAVVVALVRKMPVAPITPNGMAALVAMLFPVVTRYRRRSVDLARDYYASLNPAGIAPDVAVPDYEPKMLAKTLDTFVAGRVEAEETHDIAAVQGAAAVGRHVEQAGREYVALASSRDNVRFARYDPYGETCAFCLLLISRGPVYLSESTGAFRSHPGCTCVAVPVFDTQNWPGKAQYEAAEELYFRSTHGTSGKESLRAFRRAVEGDG